MANGIVESVYIIDSAAGNSALSFPTKAKILGVGAWFSTGAGEVQLTGTDTSQVLIRLASTVSGNNSVYEYLGGVNFQAMKVPVLTNGTAWLYLG